MANYRMSQQQLAERTLPDLKTALAMTGKRQGLRKISLTYDLHPQALYNNLNLNDPDRNPTLQQFELITEYARDHGDLEQILDALSLLTGCVWTPLPEPAVASDEVNLFREVAALVQRVGSMTEHTHESIQDGWVNPDELAVLERDLVRLMGAGHRLIQAAKLFGGRHA